MLEMTEVEAAAIAKRAAEDAVQRLLMRLGIDTEEPESFATFRRNQQFLTEWRQNAEIVKKQGIRTVVGVLLAGALGWLGYVFWPR